MWLFYTFHMSPASIRSFFACEISPELRKNIEKLQSELKAVLPRSVKWVNPGNIHLTIKFIGEFNPSHRNKLETSLTKALETIKPFKIAIKGLGVFPSFSKPRIIWLGINAEKELAQLVQIVNQECIYIGYPREKRSFSAHITIGRVKSYTNSEDRKSIADEIKSRGSIIIGSQTIESLLFIKSNLTPSGPIYKNLSIFPFSP